LITTWGERAHQTLQDRLIKELHLANIANYQDANDFFENYILLYNQNFAVQPVLPVNCHEPLSPENELDLIFRQKVGRTFSADLEFQLDRIVYQIITERPAFAL
jgi:hypothetical protein